MGMAQLAEQYQEQLNNVKMQIKEMERNAADDMDWRRYRQLKQMKTELEFNICHIKKYVKKG